MNVILGGGIAGIAAAYFARRKGKEATIFEMNARAGGLVDCFMVEGFRFDNAIHLSFAKEPEVREVFDRTPYFAHPPVALNWDGGTWLRHPVQNNMFPLLPEEKVELIASFIARSDIEVRNYRDWLLYQYGEKIATRWPIRFTEKYWTIPAERLGLNWIGDRVRRADLREILLGAMMAERPNYYYASEMRYPEEGGYRAFVAPMMEHCDIRANHRVVRVDVENRWVHFSDGTQVEYTGLVSTIPLPELLPLISDAPREVTEAAASLFATSVDLISVGFSRENVSPSLWFYIYDEDIAAARAYAPSLKSPDNVPRGCSSLQFEIYSSRHRPLTMNVDEIKANTLHAIEKMNLASRDSILFMHHKRLPYGNVVFDLGMEERRDIVRKWLENVGILLAGRFGEWDYLWSNQSFMSGMRAADHLT